MNDHEQRIKILEEKVKILEETLDTLRKFHMSEQMAEYIQSSVKAIRLVDLVNSLGDKPAIDISEEEEQLRTAVESKKTVDEQIAVAVGHAVSVSARYAADPKYFDYEVEDGRDDEGKVISSLSPFIGRGIRILAYKGFAAGVAVIPAEIDGKPVTSIGKNAFYNAEISEIIIPESVKAIFDSAFEGCTNLKGVELPRGLTHLGAGSFSGTGLLSVKLPDSLISMEACFHGSSIEHITFPNSIERVRGCHNCTSLKSVTFGAENKAISNYAFQGCLNLEEITLPEGLEEIGFAAFGNTGIKTLVIPKNVKKISCKAFKLNNRYGDRRVTCIFLGEKTEIEPHSDYRYGVDPAFDNVGMIYCLPGSEALKFARENDIPAKPVGEFRTEDISI